MVKTSFITNEEGNKLHERFNEILNVSQFFDCLVGYFYVSGFYKLENSLENVEKIRILIGMGTDTNTFELINASHDEVISSADVKKKINENIIKEMERSKDTSDVERGAKKFVKWLQDDKLEIRAYKERKTHSKLYVMSFPDGSIDDGRVITGSSNLTQPGLTYNLEFNVELSRPEDYEYAKNKFNELWENSIPVTEDYVKTLPEKTWINDTITPYELYLKFIYEWLYEQINNDKKELESGYFPKDFKYLAYQRDAVIKAKEIVEEHNGVFLSDVVGLGKTYMGSLLAKELPGTTLVIAPPRLVDEHNPGGWRRVLNEFEVKYIIESRGKLDKILENYSPEQYQNVIIDESHEFRNEDTQGYELLSQICQGKRVILISATPFNNSISDLLSQIKLFQKSHRSTLPNPKVRDLENYFKGLLKKISQYDKKENPNEYIQINQDVAKDIRENVLRYLMVRRTRLSIMENYNEDLKKNNMEFPNVQPPHKIYYEFDEYINIIFDETLRIITQELNYAKYSPLSEKYFKKPDSRYQNAQIMMANFIKILLVKRLESSVSSFKKSVANSIRVHETVLNNLINNGKFFTSRDYNRKIYELIANDDIDAIQRLIDEDKANEYSADEFNPIFEEDLNEDLILFKKIAKMWESVEDYPKQQVFINLLNTELKGKKIIIFTEFIDTAESIEKIVKENVTDRVLIITGKSSPGVLEDVRKNFDANYEIENQRDDYDILITTDVLSHGVNLHRANIVMNYDIPWNPTKMMQRVGRVQRLGTKFKNIHIYNFFPTEPIENEIFLETSAKNKIASFIELLGNDSQLLTDEPIRSYDLFDKLNSVDLEDDDVFVDNELPYLSLLRNIMDNDIKLFKKI